MGKKIGLISILFVFLPLPIYAGMPVLHRSVLSEIAKLHLSTISFFFLVFLSSTWLVKYLWNSIVPDLTTLPKLTYGKALALMVLWGMLFNLVLTMIAGGRELMTPTAWEPAGATYKLVKLPKIDYDTLEKRHLKRKQALQKLKTALWQYSADHDGKFPAQKDDIAREFWTMHPETKPLIYIDPSNHRKADAGQNILVYESEEYGKFRYAILTDGNIELMSIDAIKASIEEN